MHALGELLRCCCERDAAGAVIAAGDGPRLRGPGRAQAPGQDRRRPADRARARQLRGRRHRPAAVIVNESERECEACVRERFRGSSRRSIVKTTRSSLESFREILRRRRAGRAAPRLDGGRLLPAPRTSRASSAGAEALPAGRDGARRHPVRPRREAALGEARPGQGRVARGSAAPAATRSRPASTSFPERVRRLACPPGLGPAARVPRLARARGPAGRGRRDREGRRRGPRRGRRPRPKSWPLSPSPAGATTAAANPRAGTNKVVGGGRAGEWQPR